MQEENRRVAIRNLQRYLRALSYDEPRIPAIAIDGFYDAQTEAAVRAFQELYGLPITGRVDQATFERLYQAFVQDRERRGPPQRISHFPRFPQGYTIEVGDQQFLASVIQHALSELAIDYDFPTVPQITGVYDEDTAAAIRFFQALNGLPATGGVDLATWNALANVYNRTFADSFEQ